MLENTGAHLFSTAQTAKHSSLRMLDMIDAVEQSSLSSFFKPSRGKGDAGLELLANGAKLKQFTPNEEAIHGETALYVDLDEIWYFSQAQGDAILGGVRPSAITLGPRAQRWYTSTMGTLSSEFMNDMVEKGRAGTKAGMCYIEFSLPEGLDYKDPANWWTFHPALGNTITEQALRDELESMSEGEFMRAYMNRLTDVQDTFIPLQMWDDLADNELMAPALDDISVAFEVAPQNACAAVVAAWQGESGPCSRVIHQAPGTAWLIPYLQDLYARGITRLAADGAGPVRRIIDSIGDTLPVKVLEFQERRLADQTFITAARDDHTLTHDGSDVLRQALSAAQIRRVNGLELLDREKSLAPIPSLIAASIALYADTHREDLYIPVLVA
nr:MAG TPA: Large Terminase [Caudoviricetes sp.]